MNVTFDNYNVDSLYYVYPDRLGSYTHITNSSKQVVRALHFDPWGNVKSDGYFHSDYLFGSAAPHYINYNNCVNLENTLAYAFHESDMMTDADGTTYRTEYYWAAVGAGGAHQYKVGKGHWKRILSPYKETGRWYTREVKNVGTSNNQYIGVSPISVTSASLNISSDVFWNPKANRWVGKNLKTYDFNFNGNKITGGRNKFAKANSKGLRVGGKVLGIASTVFTMYNLLQAETIDDQAWMTVELLADGIGYIPDVGPFFTLYWNLGGRELHRMWYNNVLMPQIQMGVNPGLMIYQSFK